MASCKNDFLCTLLYMSITLLCTFLCRRCTTTTWKCPISLFVKNVNTRQWLSFYFRELWSSLLEFNCRKIGRVGISTITFEEARIHFFSDVFIAVAVVIWELKQQRRRRRRLQKKWLQKRSRAASNFTALILISFNSSNVGNFFWRWILKDCIDVQKVHR